MKIAPDSWARAEPWPKLGASALLLVFVPCWVAGARPAPPRATHRNVYGIYRVLEEVRTEGTLRLLTHGAIVHGSQLLEQPRMATTYYGAGSPVVDVLQSFAPPRDVGVVGLGVGTLAAHFGAGERLVFFELDPDNEAIAREHFSFLDDCAAIPTVEPGDARLNLAQAEDGRFQVLAVDAFSGDAIPVHLLTREALALYLSKLRPEGILALHVSNRFVDLRPVLLATGSTLGVEALTRSSRQSADRPLESESDWVAFSRSATARTRLRAAGWSRVAELDLPQARPWTDDHASLLGPLISAALR